MTDDLAHEGDPVTGRGGHGDGRVQRFVRRYGWRAIALPVLTAVAVVALLVSVISPPERDSATAKAHAATTASSPSDAPGSVAPSTVVDEPAPTGSTSTAGPTPGFVQSGDGKLSVVPGGSAVLGTAGPVTTFDVETEGGLGVDGAEFAAEVEKVLGDPRSWVGGGTVRFQRVADENAALHITLVSPQHVEGLCPGYGTNGFTSCRYRDRVVINLARWSVGVDDYAGHLGEYREYVVNHEVGHYLGHSHVPCPAPGAKAPVMMQQTLGVAPCVMNAWPYPNGPSDNVNAPA